MKGTLGLYMAMAGMGMMDGFGGLGGNRSRSTTIDVTKHEVEPANFKTFFIKGVKVRAATRKGAVKKADKIIAEREKNMVVYFDGEKGGVQTVNDIYSK
jgi:hypothetical protein